MKENLEFVYDGLSSRHMGIVQCHLNSGLFEETFIPTRSIQEEKIRGNDKPYFYGFTYEPLSFPISLYFDGELDSKKLREIANWFNVNYYKPLYFLKYPNRIFYCMPVDDSQHIHNGLKQGYLTLNMRCDSSYSYSPDYTTKIYTYQNNNGSILEFNNRGDVNCSPLLLLQKIGDGDISIANLSLNGREFKFTSLLDKEELIIDNEKQTIETNVPLTYRYDNFNFNYLVMARGINRLLINGDCKLQFKGRFKTLQ
ncbi:phage tail domain-containing protein [Cytobacillus praedii]|uniref:Phage tail protein n=1 Tax=Cytobacillus praedii TaxID=1742358 RepID=A0A4R1AMQ5_9BACI|nr:phage tail domain-containing protein [Cytobacillus praedii]TCJ01043.1 hypothetical protein E0Y62_25940 [Cytobacillus praedii]